jgi:hypothetical protein
VQAKDLQIFALWCLGNAELALDRLIEAHSTFEHAMALLGSSASAYRHDVQAGLVRVALARLDAAAAMHHALPLLAHLDTNTGPGKQGDAPLVDTARGWGGTLGARLIQVTLVRALQATQHPRAQAVLQDAHADLQSHAAAITDPVLRDSFLQRVPDNLALVQAFAASQRGVATP